MPQGVRVQVPLFALDPMIKKILIALIGLGIAFYALCSHSPYILIHGAGASFPYPLYLKWFSEYEKKDQGLRLNYQPMGSGAGIRQLQEKTIDFAATDIPMTDEQLGKLPFPLVHIPTTVGAIAIVYHLPTLSFKKQVLKLTQKVLARIFLGEITHWNDSELKKINPDLILPHQPIFLVYRSDGSGTSAIITDFLSQISQLWKEKVGKGPSVQWPVGLGSKGNEGVAGFVRQTPGALGYVELIFAKQKKIPFAAIENQQGELIEPSLESVAAAAAYMNDPSFQLTDFRVSLINSPQKGAYPISAFTYFLINPKMDTEKAKKMASFLKWAMRDGQQLSPSLFFSALPTQLVHQIGIRLENLF